MPDITMCTNQGCADRLSCYRFIAQPSEYRQSYADYVKDRDNCYWEVKVSCSFKIIKGKK